MTRKEVERVREAILVKIDQLGEDIRELEEITRPVSPDSAIGRISRMDAIVNKGVSEGILHKSRAQLILLQDALGKVDRKGFGVCTRCGKEIPMDRLLAMPESVKCVQCA